MIASIRSQLMFVALNRERIRGVAALSVSLILSQAALAEGAKQKSVEKNVALKVKVSDVFSQRFTFIDFSVTEKQDGTNEFIGTGKIDNFGGESIVGDLKVKFTLPTSDTDLKFQTDDDMAIWPEESTGIEFISTYRSEIMNSVRGVVHFKSQDTIISFELPTTATESKSQAAFGALIKLSRLIAPGAVLRGGALLNDQCDPTFNECVTSANSACWPLSAEVEYECDPSTGFVHCSWTCVVN
ncbi:MAG: hypothetical protein AB7N71_05965 [Phycisphaerae bacterium]